MTCKHCQFMHKTRHIFGKDKCPECSKDKEYKTPDIQLDKRDRFEDDPFWCLYHKSRVEIV